MLNALYEENLEFAPEVDDETAEIQKRSTPEEEIYQHECETYESLTKHVGWQLLSKWLYARIDSAKINLVEENDPAKIVRHQQTARAYADVLGFIDSKVAEAQALHEQKLSNASTDPAKLIVG